MFKETETSNKNLIKIFFRKLLKLLETIQINLYITKLIFGHYSCHTLFLTLLNIQLDVT